MHLCFRLLAVTVWQSTFMKPFRPLRAIFLLLAVTAYVLFELFLSICLALDYVFFPGFRLTPVVAPVFIIGNPRSGTTHLHRLMALDEEQFTSFTFLDLLFPALTQRACLSFLRRIDPYLGRPFHRIKQRIETRFMAPRDKLHYTRFDEPEEDDWLSMHKFASPVLAAIFGRSTALGELTRFDEAPAALRRSVIGFYKACVQRHLYWVGRGRTLLSKNPTFPAKIRSLREAFPDGRFVYILRCPEVALASVNSLYVAARTRYGGPAPTPDQLRKVYDTMCYMYRYAFEQLEQLPAGDACIVEYEQLVSGPEQLVRRIYDAIRLTRTEVFERRLREATAEARRYRSRHQYSLESAGLTAQDVRSALPFIYARFSFEETVAEQPAECTT
jgi:hypothetical protein